MTLTIMLAVHCKKSEPADLKPALVEYVRESYGQQVGCGASGRCGYTHAAGLLGG